MEPGVIFIPENVPSSKNSRVNTRSGSFFSPSVRKYLQKLGIKNFSSSKKIVEEYKSESRPNRFKEALEGNEFYKYKPLILGFHPVRDSKRRFDLHNCFQIIGDLLQAHGIIEDDDATHLIPVPMEIDGEYFSVDKENPGIYLKVLNGSTKTFKEGIRED